VFGQSGTAKPAPWLVTNPPKQIRTSVAPAVNTAKRQSHGWWRRAEADAGLVMGQNASRREADSPAA
jgi:hypothetical protein